MISSFPIVLAVCWSFQNPADLMSTDQFLSEYTQACTALKHKYAEVHGSGLNGVEPQPKTGSFRFNFDGEKQKVEFSYKESKSDPKHPNRFVSCVTGEGTGFGLSRSPGDGAYVVNWIDVDERHKAEFMQDIQKFVWAPFAPYASPLIDYLTDASVKDLTARRTTAAGMPAVQVDYKNGDPKNPNSNTVVLLPNAGWAIHSYQTYPQGFSPEKKPMQIAVEYSTPIGETPTPRLVRYTDANLKCEVFEFQTFEFGPTSDPEFSMEYYKLPDLARPTGRSFTGSFWWLVGFAVLTAAAAVCFKRSSKRPRHA